MGDTPECLICLCPAQIQKPLYLLACGCKIGWLHEPCEKIWMSYKPVLEYPRCPGCRQKIPLEYTYSFFSLDSNDQFSIVQTIVVLVSEFSFAVTSFSTFGLSSFLLPLQGSMFLLFPFVIPSYLTIINCLAFTNLHGFLVLASILLYLPFEQSLRYTFLLNVGYIELFIFSLLHVVRYITRPHEYRIVHPLAPFAIEGRLKHAKKFLSP